MVMVKRRSAADVRGATNHHKSESPASQQAGSTDLDTLSPVELQVLQGIRRGRHPVDAAQGWMLPAVVRDAMGPAVLPPPGPPPARPRIRLRGRERSRQLLQRDRRPFGLVTRKPQGLAQRGEFAPPLGVFSRAARVATQHDPLPTRRL